MTSSYVAISWVDVGAWDFLETKVDKFFWTMESNFVPERNGIGPRVQEQWRKAKHDDKVWKKASVMQKYMTSCLNHTVEINANHAQPMSNQEKCDIRSKASKSSLPVQEGPLWFPLCSVTTGSLESCAGACSRFTNLQLQEKITHIGWDYPLESRHLTSCHN